MHECDLGSCLYKNYLTLEANFECLAPSKTLESTQPKGQGYRFCKFNSSLLEDFGYTKNVASEIPQFIENYKHLGD